MRILSWNVNGIRTLSQYHPWYTLKTCEEMLKELGADIICFQEMKLSRQLLTKPFAVPEGYDAVMSFPKNKGGYSGVSVYSKSAEVVALKAEEGLTGGQQATSKILLEPNERISKTYPEAATLELMPNELGIIPNDLSELDDEGRALVVDFGLFVLINVYCPNQTSDERLPFKYNFHKLLEERVQKLLDEGREIIALGDMNVVAAPVDHCEGSLESKKNDFWERPVRTWFRQWLDPEGPMVDVIRKVWPEREEMYTCWDTRTNARESNYGTRIDYILFTKGLLPWLKHGDILPDIRGSDHCPVFIDLHDEITLPDGQVLRLSERISQPVDETGQQRNPPPISTRFWDEFSRKQKLLSTFFAKKSTEAVSEKTIVSGIDKPIHEAPLLENPRSLQGLDNVVAPAVEPDFVPDSPSPTDSPQSLKPSQESTSQPSIAVLDRKRKSSGVANQLPDLGPRKTRKSATTEERNKQSKLAAFFVVPSVKPKRPNGRSSSPPIELVEDSDDETTPPSSSQINRSIHSLDIYGAPSSQTANGTSNKAAWSQLMKPIEPPQCAVHNVSTKELTVNKPGPNKGKKFFICSMPMGPGYDSGKSTRLREEVDPRYRCNYFKWANDVRKEAGNN